MPKDVSIYCSFVQIYNEKIYDLLLDGRNKKPLLIREDRAQGIYVDGLSEYIVQNAADCLAIMRRGEKNRANRQTKMNVQSSRSHTIFQLLLESNKIDAKGMIRRSKLNLGDLAGSEKIDKDEEMVGQHMLELRSINQSLSTLGKVIMALAQKKAPPYVPFRESKLTRLLQDSIGGNCCTYLVATVSPTEDCCEESLSTLKFADRATHVVQKVKRNEINAKDDALILKLQSEISYLRELLKLTKKGKSDELASQLYLLKQENRRLRSLALTNEQIESMMKENKAMKLQLQALQANISKSDFESQVHGLGSEMSQAEHGVDVPS